MSAHRENLGRLVRQAWIAWAREQYMPKASWLVPYDELEEADKEADRRIGHYVEQTVLLAAVRGIAAQFNAHDPTVAAILDALKGRITGPVQP